MNKYSLSALVAAGLLAGGLTVSSANAADLGGNCCADLEERIAELEATTARKGNRKVSLTISGWVAEQAVYFDDGEESNIYVGGIGTTLASHVKFTGQATIAPGWTAGYVLHLEANTTNTFGYSAATDDPAGAGVGVLQSYWFIKSDHLGKVSLGKQSQASDNTAILVDGSGSLVPANWVMFEGPGFGIRQNGGQSGLTWGDINYCYGIDLGIGGDCNGVTEEVVRYDSPTFGGFSFSASWGEDDMWDVAARYAGEFSGFKLAVAGAYSQISDENLITPYLGDGGGAGKDIGYFQIGAYVQHVPTGLFVYGAYGVEDVDSTYSDPIGDGAGGELNPIDDNPDHWYLKAGIRQKWTPLGHTVLYGEYSKGNDQLNPLVADDFDGAITGTEVRGWGLGVVQEIDAAAMSIWLTYRNFEADVNTTNGSLDGLEDLDIIKFGALINF